MVLFLLLMMVDVLLQLIQVKKIMSISEWCKNFTRISIQFILLLIDNFT
jgi:hypothetical protein